MKFLIFGFVTSLTIATSVSASEYSYHWEFGGQAYEVGMNISDELVSNCLSKIKTWQSEAGTFSKGGDNYLRYLRNYPCGSYSLEIATKLRSIAEENEFDRYQTANFLISFVKSFPYIYDSKNQKVDHYAQTPFETLILGKGDCEDHAVMLAYFYTLFCYDTVLIITEDVESRHLAVGISQDAVNNQYWNSRKFIYNNKTYLYCEATPCANEPCNSLVGECSGAMSKMKIVEYFEVPLNCRLKY